MSSAKKILLVEDDPFLVDIYKHKLEEVGFNIDITDDGQEALEKIQSGGIDLVLLDIVLPGAADGWKILQQIRGDLGLKDLKVAVLSNLGQKDEVEKGIELGATQYLIKAHYTPSEVVEEVRKMLN